MEADSVRGHLARVLDSPLFGDAAQPARLLTYLVEETLQGRADYLKAYTIATTAFGQPENFDPQSNPTVRVAAHRLRALLSLYYADEGQRDDVIITIPKGSYVPRFEPGASRQKPETAQAHARENQLGLPVITVCPIERISTSDQAHQFAAGLEQELILALSRFEEIITVPHDEMSSAARRASETREIGRRTGADFLITASLQTNNQVARVIVNLIGQLSGRCIWADSFDINLKTQDVFDRLRETAREIASLIAQPFGHAHRDQTWHSRTRMIEDLNVYECLLQSHVFYDGMGDHNFGRAIAAARRATELAPDQAATWATLSELYSSGYLEGFGDWRKPKDMLEGASYCAQRAIELNPQSARANLAQSVWHFTARETDDFLKFGDRALLCNPKNSELVAVFGMYRAYSGDWSSGLGMIKEVITRQPMHPDWFLYAFMDDAFRQGDYRSYLKIDKLLNFDDFHMRYVSLVITHCLLGEQEKADEALRVLRTKWPDFSAEDAEEIWRRAYRDDLLKLCIEGLRASRLTI